MPALDVRGKIAAAQIAFYVPVAVLTILLVFRYAFRRDAGWFFLLIFALVRITGGALLVAAEMQPSNIDLFIAAYIIQFAGLALLMMSTIGFLGMAGQHTYSDVPRLSIMFRIIGLLALTALAVSIAGGLLGTHVNPDAGSTGLILRRVGAGIFAGLYVALTLIHFGTWTYRWHLKSYRRNLLWGISTALPFLGVRVAYSVLAAWSSSDLFGLSLSSNPTLARFNPITGDWVPFLIMSLVMEYAVVLIYLLSSTWLSRRRL
ncbi:hypothetical protein BDQ12DRAFT_633010 [Crucibulum laeve]|uniref:DUF7702 domain-containing protein n=1 Tax=Crucibulum laeve TaxID=68775 RepID=A0A5C3LUC7_9AGAR|nr:hypothetical protein BDQ12DRAFT_633010 [Crucibulum laeve]